MQKKDMNEAPSPRSINNRLIITETMYLDFVGVWVKTLIECSEKLDLPYSITVEGKTQTRGDYFVNELVLKMKSMLCGGKKYI